MQLIIWAVIVVGSILLDQVTKYWAVKELMPIGSTILWEGLLGLRYVENTGAAFGMMKGQRWFFIILSTVAIIAISIYLIKYRRTVPSLLGIALAMIVGGGIGNQIDRILNGYVVDFFEFLFIDFAIFNVADCFVTVGAFLIILDMLFVDRNFLLGETTSKATRQPRIKNRKSSLKPNDITSPSITEETIAPPADESSEGNNS